MAKLAVGDKAPAFSLPDEDGKTVSLSDFAGRRVVIYFYPADDTPGCTKEACQFTELRDDFDRLDTDIIGVSRDNADSHRRFRERYGLKVRLLTDEDHSVMERFGAWGEKNSYGKTTVGVIRSTFLVDSEGKIAGAWYNVKADGHAQSVLTAVGG